VNASDLEHYSAIYQLVNSQYLRGSDKHAQTHTNKKANKSYERRVHYKYMENAKLQHEKVFSRS
jgi:hypothetical protein